MFPLLFCFVKGNNLSYLSDSILQLSPAWKIRRYQTKLSFFLCFVKDLGRNDSFFNFGMEFLFSCVAAAAEILYRNLYH